MFPENQASHPGSHVSVDVPTNSDLIRLSSALVIPLDSSITYISSNTSASLVPSSSTLAMGIMTFPDYPSARSSQGNVVGIMLGGLLFGAISK